MDYGKYTGQINQKLCCISSMRQQQKVKKNSCPVIDNGVSLKITRMSQLGAKRNGMTISVYVNWQDSVSQTKSDDTGNKVQTAK